MQLQPTYPLMKINDGEEPLIPRQAKGRRERPQKEGLSIIGPRTQSERSVVVVDVVLVVVAAVAVADGDQSGHGYDLLRLLRD